MLMPKRVKYRKQHRGRMKGKESRGVEVSFGELQTTYTLDPGLISPDGYQLAGNSGHDGIFEIFGSRDEPDWFLKRGSVRLPMHMVESTRSYYHNPQSILLGWVINE